MLKKNIRNLTFFILLVSTMLYFTTMSFAYTPPTYNNINFTLCSSYTPPTYNGINFTLSTTETCGAPPSDTCTYTSGNWDIDCSDNCTIALNTTINTGYNITFSGTGYFNIPSNIFVSNWKYLYAPATCHLITHTPGGLVQ